MPTGIDHVIILVDDLERGIEQYRKLGFTVTPGGKHPRYTHNALVTFADGSYLELIAFYEHPTSADSGPGHRWYKHVGKGGGIIDYALAAPNLDAVVADADARGFTHGAATPGARKRTDDVEIAWKSSMAKGDPNVGGLPFLIEDVTDRGLRVPSESATHDNTVRGIESLVVAVEDLDAAIKRYCTMLDRESPSGDGLPNLDNADGVYFLVGQHRIDLATPTGAGPLADHLKANGDGPYELSLLARETVDITPSAAGNARLRFVAG
jgi:catechol 2,3-dioxygenase-like lactoylglutathione lyase family enzyme